MKGYTFYIVFGESADFNFEWTKWSKRICLGKIAIALVAIDVEIALDKAIRLAAKK
jgi:hypothetical protein